MWPFKRTPAVETKALASPSDDLYALFGLVPTTASAVPVMPESALRLPAVGSAIRVISEAVACLDVAVKRVEADGGETPVPTTRSCPLRSAANHWSSPRECPAATTRRKASR